MEELFSEISLKELLLGSEKWHFLAETALRTLVMFLVILTSLRLLGKRGIKQLSVFELGVIIGLGSAAGDPMFYKDVGLLPGILVFVIVTGLYRLLTHLINRHERLEDILEGEPICLVDDGHFVAGNLTKEPLLARDEFFAQLRLHSVSHLGQVHQAIVETNGEVSVFFYSDEEVRYGLPVLPHLYKDQHETIERGGHYACAHCGYTAQLAPGAGHRCPVCGQKLWVPAIKDKRIS